MSVTINPALQAIHKKLSALLTLEEQPGTPQEAVAATEAIQRLLLKYNITRDEIHRSDEIKSKYDRLFVNLKTTTPWLTEWKIALAAVIANHNLCVVTHIAKKGIIFIFGEEHNIVVVKQLFDFLCEQLQRLQREAREGLSLNTGVEWRDRKWVRAFYLGAVHMINYRLDKLQEELLEEFPTSTALALRTREEIFEQCQIKMDKARKRTITEEAYSIGMQAGTKVTLQKTLTSSNA